MMASGGLQVHSLFHHFFPHYQLSDCTLFGAFQTRIISNITDLRLKEHDSGDRSVGLNCLSDEQVPLRLIFVIIVIILPL